MTLLFFLVFLVANVSEEVFLCSAYLFELIPPLTSTFDCSDDAGEHRIVEQPAVDYTLYRDNHNSFQR